MENKAYTHIFNDILEKVLNLSDNPSQFAEYLTQQIRELVGARTIVISIKSTTGLPQIFSVFPTRRTEWAQKSTVLELAEITFSFKEIMYLDHQTSEEAIAAKLKELEIEKAIAIPLIAANQLVGSLLLFDMMDLFGIESVLDLLTQLSGVFALVIRNAHLYQNMEELVEIRTKELLSRNKELEERGIQLIETEDRYKQLSDMFRNMADIIPDMLWAKDLDSNFTFVNQSFCDKLLIAENTQEPIGKNDLFFAERQRALQPENPNWHTFGEMCRDSDLEVIETGTTNQFDEYGNIKGQFLYLDVIKTPLKNLKGEIIGVVGTGRDVTYRKKAEMELIAAKNHAEESDRLKTAFLANMSHEIRTPMNGILGFAELLKEPTLSGEQQQNYLRIIEKSGLRMLNILNEIIDISRIESGLMKVTNNECNVNILMNDLYHFFLSEAELKGLTLNLENALPSDIAIITTDRDKLNAIVTNLVKNALKFTVNGSISFGYTLKTSDTSNAIQELEFFVKDTGIGIPNDRQMAIFERFIQADIEDTKAMQGAGLGLAISKSYVEMLGGSIWVESKVDVGSSFYFTLPIIGSPIENDSIQTVPVQSKVDNAPPMLKILIVDDDETSMSFLNIVLNKYGREILNAVDGVEAIAQCHKHPDIDLILMDMQMPNVGGVEATRQIRTFNKKVIIIAQTAFGLAGDRDKAMEAGCTDYISKPINATLLKNIVSKHFN